MKKQIIGFAIVIAFLFSSCKKDPDDPNITKLPIWKTYDQSNGLVNNLVSDIAVDAAGNKWFAVSSYSPEIDAEAGLCKFDGTNWTTYTTANSGLVHNLTTKLEIDLQGNLWIGYGQTTEGSGVSKFDGTDWTTYTSSNSGLVSNQVTAIAIDSLGNKWFGTSYGLSKFNGAEWTTFNSHNGLGSDFIFEITVDHENNVWVGTWGGGVAKYDGTNWMVYNRSNSGLPENIITAIAVDKQGVKWFGTSTMGVVKFSNEIWTSYNSYNTNMLSNDISDIAIDKNGVKWISTNGWGVSSYNGQYWSTYSPEYGYTDYYVTCISIDNDNKKWFGTYLKGAFSLED
jgi:ligand-binding sensor domain-containing protein